VFIYCKHWKNLGLQYDSLVPPVLPHAISGIVEPTGAKETT
jgi:hypothetical protein